MLGRARCNGEGHQTVTTKAMPVQATQATNTAVGPPAPPTIATTSDPSSADELSQYEIRRLPAIMPSVERATIGRSAAPVGRSVFIAPSPTTTNAATAGVGRPSAEQSAALAKATVWTANPPTRTECGRYLAVRFAATGAQTRAGESTASDTNPTADEPPHWNA